MDEKLDVTPTLTLEPIETAAEISFTTCHSCTTGSSRFR